MSRPSSHSNRMGNTSLVRLPTIFEHSGESLSPTLSLHKSPRSVSSRSLVPLPVPEKREEQNVEESMKREVIPENGKGEVNEEDLVEVDLLLSEIMNAEDTYIALLETCINVLLEPIEQSANDSDLEPRLNLQPEQVRAIFSNMQQLYGVSCKFCDDLRGATTGNTVESRLVSFCGMVNAYAPSFKMYSMYASNLNRANAIVAELRSNSEYSVLHNFLQVTESSGACKGKTLESFLLLPFEHVPRLLASLDRLSRIVNQMTSNDAVKQTKVLLSNILKKLNECMEKVNETIRARENGEIIAKIQEELGCDCNLFSPNRTFVKREPMTLVTNWSPECESRAYDVREVFLFSDLLVYTTETVGFWSNSTTVHQIPLDANCACEMVRDASCCGIERSLLRIGRKFGGTSIVVEFASFLLLMETRLLIEELCCKACPLSA